MSFFAEVQKDLRHSISNMVERGMEEIGKLCVLMGHGVWAFPMGHCFKLKALNKGEVQ